MKLIDNLMITQQIANNTLNYFNFAEGFDGGHFATKLYELMSHADQANLSRIAEGFPGQVAAFEMARKSDTGIQALRIIATGEYNSVRFSIVGAN